MLLIVCVSSNVEMSCNHCIQCQKNFCCIIPDDTLTHLSKIPMDEKDLQSSINRAAVFIANSLHDRDIYHKTDATAIKLYWIYYNRFVRTFCLFIVICLLSLAIFERPAVIPVRHGITQAFELLFLLIILARMCIYFRLYGWQNFRWNGWKIFKFILIIASLIDCSFSIVFPHMFRITKILRPFFLAEHVSVLRARISLIFRTIAKMPEFLFLMLFNVLFHSLIAYTLFSTNDHDHYFSNLYDSFLNIFILQTTANYPDVTIPAVTEWPFSSLFFVWFLLLQLYFVFNLNIAFVFNNYKAELENRKVASYIRNRVALLAAFRMLDSDLKGYIDLETWKALFKVYRPRSSEAKAISKFEMEDVNRTGKVDLCQFFRLCDDIKKKIHVAPHARRAIKGLRYAPLLKIVNHKIFKTVILVLIGLNCFLAIFQIVFENPRKPKLWSKIFDIFFILAFLVELILKFIAQGPLAYVKKKWNLYDSFIVIASVVGLILESAHITQLKPTVLIAGMRILRILRFIRYFSISDRLRLILDTFFEVFPTTLSQITIVIVWYYAYGVLGMDIFAGKLVRGNPALVDTDYNALDFYNVANFNNILNTFLTEFHLTVVNNWHVTMRGAIAVTSKWACLYFIFFWIISVIILMNLVVATVLDVFSNKFVQKQKRIRLEKLKKIEEERQAKELSNVHILNNEQQMEEISAENDKNEPVTVQIHHIQRDEHENNEV
jgi:two pore calcium channel protein 1